MHLKENCLRLFVVGGCHRIHMRTKFHLRMWYTEQVIGDTHHPYLVKDMADVRTCLSPPDLLHLDMSLQHSPSLLCLAEPVVWVW